MIEQSVNLAWANEWATCEFRTSCIPSINCDRISFQQKKHHRFTGRLVVVFLSRYRCALINYYMPCWDLCRYYIFESEFPTCTIYSLSTGQLKRYLITGGLLTTHISLSDVQSSSLHSSHPCQTYKLKSPLTAEPQSPPVRPHDKFVHELVVEWSIHIISAIECQFICWIFCLSRLHLLKLCQSRCQPVNISLFHRNSISLNDGMV